MLSKSELAAVVRQIVRRLPNFGVVAMGWIFGRYEVNFLGSVNLSCLQHMGGEELTTAEDGGFTTHYL